MSVTDDGRLTGALIALADVVDVGDVAVEETVDELDDWLMYVDRWVNKRALTSASTSVTELKYRLTSLVHSWKPKVYLVRNGDSSLVVGTKRQKCLCLGSFFFCFCFFFSSCY